MRIKKAHLYQIEMGLLNGADVLPIELGSADSSAIQLFERDSGEE